jgi:hypothetical protein
MITSQTVRRIERLEGLTAMHDRPRPEFVIDYIEAADGYPSGKVLRVRYGAGGQTISEEELFIDPATLRHEPAQRSRGN